LAVLPRGPLKGTLVCKTPFKIRGAAFEATRAKNPGRLCAALVALTALALKTASGKYLCPKRSERRVLSLDAIKPTKYL